MNERIRELAKQARQIGEYVNYGQIRLSPEQFEQKFAELIAQDAVNTLRKRWFDANNSVPSTSDARLQAIHNGRKIGLMESVDALVEHFGLDQ